MSEDKGQTSVVDGSILDVINQGFAKVNSSLETVVQEQIKQNTQQVIQTAQIEEIRQDMGALDSRIVAVEARTGRASFRIREVSQTDLEQSSQLAKEIEAREALATQVDELVKTNAVQLGILSRLDKVTQNPLVKVVATMLATAVLTWLAARGIKVPQ